MKVMGQISPSVDKMIQEAWTPMWRHTRSPLESLPSPSFLHQTVFCWYHDLRRSLGERVFSVGCRHSVEVYHVAVGVVIWNLLCLGQVKNWYWE